MVQDSFSAFLILLVLGLRHGLDPDHIAVIDGYTYRLHERKSIWAGWVGTLFAFGHGVMVTVIALVLSLVKSSLEVPEFVNYLIEWVPLLMLLMIGISNLFSLLKNKEVKVFSFRKWLLPDYFNSHLNPFSIILTGIVFGFIFDTSTQIAALGFTMSASDQWFYALIGGVVFSVGLMLTGTFDSFMLSRLLKAFDSKKIQAHRFKLNVLITVMCLVIPVYKIFCFYNSSLELDDLQNNLVGLAFLSIISGLYLELFLRYKFGGAKVATEVTEGGEVSE